MFVLANSNKGKLLLGPLMKASIHSLTIGTEKTPQGTFNLDEQSAHHDMIQEFPCKMSVWALLWNISSWIHMILNHYSFIATNNEPSLTAAGGEASWTLFIIPDVMIWAKC